MNTEVIAGVVALMLGLPVLWGLVVYNGLVRLRNKVGEAWRNVDVQLQRRHDLIPNLVAIVKGYAEHERATLEAIADLRTQAAATTERAARAAKEDALGEALDALIARAESYPQLRAADAFQSLQAELADTEDELAAARRIYNGNVLLYNNRAQTFPPSLVAAYFGFELAEPFIAAAPAHEPIAVSS